MNNNFEDTRVTNKWHEAKGMHRWLAICLLLLAACNPSIKPMAQGANFPVVKAFDLAHAGSKVAVDFTLPNAVSEGYLRPVFIGYRSGGPAGRPDSKPGDWDYLDQQDMPIHVRLWRIEAGKSIPVVLHKLKIDLNVRPGRTWSEPHPDDVFIHHRAVGEDAEELIALDQYNMDWAYRVWKIASITPSTPGHYHLEVETLQEHPQVAQLSFELLVSHYSTKGIH